MLSDLLVDNPPKGLHVERLVEHAVAHATQEGANFTRESASSHEEDPVGNFGMCIAEGSVQLHAGHALSLLRLWVGTCL